MPSPFHIVTTLLNLFAISSLIRRIVSRYEKVSEEPVVEAEKHIIPTQHRSKTTTSMSKWKRRSFLKEQKLCEKKTEKGSKERPRDWPNDIGVSCN